MYANLHSLRERPIPAPDSSPALKRAYRDLPIRQTSSLHVEKLMRASAFGVEGRNHYAHDRNPPYWAKADGAIEALLVRESVGKRLEMVNGRLKQAGLKLFLFDAWRPRAVQAYFHDVWTPAEIRRRHPDYDEAKVQAEVGRYWAAPSESPLRPAPHATGGAVDITIVWDDGVPLFMGGLFDDPSAISNTPHYEQGGDSLSHEEARANRRVLYWTMIEAGFCNHPDEWWHYSYGDQMWAALTGEDAAHYGLAEPDAELLA